MSPPALRSPLPARRRLTLEVALGVEPLTGVVYGDDGAAHPFTGWLGLASALARLTEPAAVELDPGGIA